MSRHRPVEIRLDIGEAVAIGRAGRTPWKMLARVYGRTERQLRRDLAAWEDQMSAFSLKCPVFDVAPVTTPRDSVRPHSDGVTSNGVSW